MKAFPTSASYLILFLSFIFIVSLIGLGSWGLTETSESRYAQISKEMYQSNDFVHPRLMGIYHYHKPPITYNITVLGYKIFGVNEFGARFFMQLALIIQLILVFQIARLIFSKPDIAIMASLIYFSIPLVLISVRNLTTDAYLNTFILSSIFIWLKFKKNSGRTYFIYLFFICLGIIMNIKGPVGLICPVIFIISYHLLSKQKPKFSIHTVIAIILFLFISSLWILILLKQDPSILNYLLDEQIASRINAKSYNRSKPFWFYLLTLPLTILPWLWPTLKGIFNSFKNKSSDNNSKVIALTILLVVIIFSLFSTKLILYVLPVSLFIALIAAKTLNTSSQSEKRIQIYVITGLSFLPILALFLFPLIDARYVIDYVALGTIALVSLIVTYLIFKRIKFQNGRISGLALLFGLVMISCSTIFSKSNGIYINSVKEIMTFIKNKDELKDRPIVVHNYLLPSAAFYSDKNIITLNNGHNTVQRDIRFQEDDIWNNYLIDVRGKEGLERLNDLLAEPCVIMVRRRGGKIENAVLFENRELKKVDFNKWVIYY